MFSSMRGDDRCARGMTIPENARQISLLAQILNHFLWET
jgi:hypothetical protein